MNKRITVGLSVATVSFMLFSLSAIANPGGNGKGHKNGNSHKQQNSKGKKYSDGNLTNITISVDQARGLAVSYGLVGYQSLPPGIAKNLARGKPLPPGIAKKMVPGNMLTSLPHYPGYDWYMVGNDLVLVAATTLIVNTILEGVFN